MKTQNKPRAGRSNVWGRTAPLASPRVAAPPPISLRVARLLGWVSDAEGESRESFLDTVPSVMHDGTGHS